jgi:phage replication-related protein YjqB (UPF0714/DUF867 family)
MPDKYSSFKKLFLKERNGTDFTITSREGQTNTSILVPHGGGIEPGTSELGQAIASHDHSLYDFSGIKAKNNKDLHITSTIDSEPLALKMVQSSERTISLHGCKGKEEVVYIGGKDSALGNTIARQLAHVGIEAKIATQDHIAGTSDSNICNKNLRMMGVQLELTEGLRSRMFHGLNRLGREKTTDLFNQFVTAIRDALKERVHVVG